MGEDRAADAPRRPGAATAVTVPHTSHAMLIQLHEYRERVRQAFESTYSFALQARPEAKTASAARPSSRDYFPRPEPTPSYCTAPVGVKDAVLPRRPEGYVTFHQMHGRRAEFLLGDGADRRAARLLADMSSTTQPSGIAKDHFALGPGQYDVPARSWTSTAGAAKFSPADRFHDDFLAGDRPGPGQYVTSEALTSPRPTAAVFLQMPRRTETGLLPPPHADTSQVVSSYYFVAPTGFAARHDKRNDHPSWGRAPRFEHRGRRQLTPGPAPSNNAGDDAEDSVDFVERNKRRIHAQAAVQRVRRAREAMSAGSTRRKPTELTEAPPPTVFKRRQSIFVPMAGATRLAMPMEPLERVVETHTGTASSALAARGRRRSSVKQANSNVRRGFEPVDPALLQQQQQGWTTAAVLVSFSNRLTAVFRVAQVVRQIQRAYDEHCTREAFSAWRRLDADCNAMYARALIAKNAFRYKVRLRVAHKAKQAALIREFLRGLSVDVRFALAMKRLKRRVQLLQRWWRHMQLMVRARELALYYKWVSVESRLRLEYLSQLPNVHRVFQPPPSLSASTAGKADSDGVCLHRLLNLPDQSKWFTAQFTLAPDGMLRGADIDTEELLVEVRTFRCYLHDFLSSSDDGGDDSGQRAVRWQPYLMAFRPNVFRFVLLTSSSPHPRELHEWFSKLERSAAVASTGATSNLPSPSPSVRELVDVSMQSGILSSTAQPPSPKISSQRSLASAVRRGSVLLSMSSSPRGQLQSRVRTLRQQTRQSLVPPPPLIEGELRYLVVDLLKDMPKVPQSVIWQTVRDKLRDKRKHFRADIYRYKLETFHYRQHQEQVKDLRVPDKFRDFFVRFVAVRNLLVYVDG